MNKVRELNDLCRTAMGVAGRLILTRGVRCKFDKDLSAIREAVETFDAFNESNDPYGEHDFGSFVYAGEVILWKIDYYDKTLENGSEDPSDPSKTVRVLTIMLASDY